MEEKNTKQESLGIFDRLTPIFRSMSKAGRLIEFGEAINQDLTNSDNQTINVENVIEILNKNKAVADVKNTSFRNMVKNAPKDTINDYSPYI